MKVSHHLWLFLIPQVTVWCPPVMWTLVNISPMKSSSVYLLQKNLPWNWSSVNPNWTGSCTGRLRHCLLQVFLPTHCLQSPVNFLPFHALLDHRSRPEASPPSETPEQFHMAVDGLDKPPVMAFWIQKKCDKPFGHILFSDKPISVILEQRWEA